MIYPRFRLTTKSTVLLVVIFILSLISERLGQEINVVKEYNHGIAVDSSENVYIGENSRISVFDGNGTYLRSIPTVTHAEYAFTIVEGNAILLTTEKDLSALDLNGKLLEKEERETPVKEIVQLKSRDYFISPENEVYQLKHKFFRPTIVRQDAENEVIVYQMPLWGFILRLLRMFLVLWGVVVLLVSTWKSYKLNKKTMSDEEKRNDFRRLRR